MSSEKAPQRIVLDHESSGREEDPPPPEFSKTAADVDTTKRAIQQDLRPSSRSPNYSPIKMMPPEEEFATDVLRGAEEVASFIYGDRSQRRKIYHLVATSRLPVFKLGSMICGRRSVLLKWVQDQEERHSGDIRGKPAERHSIPRSDR